MAKFTERKYIIRTRKAMEDYIHSHTLAEVIEFIKENGVIEEDEDEHAYVGTECIKHIG